MGGWILINLAQDKDQYQAAINDVMNFLEETQALTCQGRLFKE